MTICLDASVVLKLLVPEEDSPVARRLWGQCLDAAEPVRAPTLIDYEVASVLRLRAYRGELRHVQTMQCWRHYVALAIEREHDEILVTRAIEIADGLGQPRAYDATYVALAERYGATLWTADSRLVNVVRGRYAVVRHLNEA